MPGENGEAVVIDKDKLLAEDKTKFDAGWQNNAFNQYASDRISLHRSLPDIRDEGFVAAFNSFGAEVAKRRHNGLSAGVDYG